jgi:hypothetical protein
MVGLLLAVAIMAFQIRYGIISRAQANGAYWSLAWPYMGLVAAILIRHLIQPPVLIYREQELENQYLRDEVSDLRNTSDQRRPILQFSADPRPAGRWFDLAHSAEALFNIILLSGDPAQYIQVAPIDSVDKKFSICFRSG